jgi:DNA-binding NarL/FixJ family response regulator
MSSAIQVPISSSAVSSATVARIVDAVKKVSESRQILDISRSNREGSDIRRGDNFWMSAKHDSREKREICTMVTSDRKVEVVNLISRG